MLFSVCSLSLACDLSTLYRFCFGCFSFGPTHLPLFLTFPVCVFSFYLPLILLLFHLFQAVEIITRTARGALTVPDLATGQENVLPPGIAHEALSAEPISHQDIHTAPTDPLSEPTVNPVQSSNVFDDEVADFAQVHCDSELFEFE